MADPDRSVAGCGGDEAPGSQATPCDPGAGPGRTRSLRPRLLRLMDRVASRGLGAISLASKLLAVASGAIFGGAVLGGVINRYLVGGAFPYSTEIPRVLFPWFIMAGAVYAATREEHLRLEILVARLPAPLAKAVFALTSLVAIVGLFVLADVSALMVPDQHTSASPVLGWPRSLGFTAVPVGLASLALTVALRLIRVITGGSQPYGHLTGQGSLETAETPGGDQ